MKSLQEILINSVSWVMSQWEILIVRRIPEEIKRLCERRMKGQEEGIMFTWLALKFRHQTLNRNQRRILLKNVGLLKSVIDEEIA